MEYVWFHFSWYFNRFFNVNFEVTYLQVAYSLIILESWLYLTAFYNIFCERVICYVQCWFVSYSENVSSQASQQVCSIFFQLNSKIKVPLTDEGRLCVSKIEALFSSWVVRLCTVTSNLFLHYYGLWTKVFFVKVVTFDSINTKFAIWTFQCSKAQAP